MKSDVVEKSTVDSERAVIAKVAKRLIWFLFIVNVFAYLDRINIGFAALTMNKALGLSATEFGFASTIFYIGYIAFEIPSNLLLVRFGARTWLARIMVTWGLASTATMLVSSDVQLYIVRLLLGIAEAGLIPGVLLYLTYWFPESHRARFNGRFLIGQPVALALGSFVSGVMLDLHGLMGLDGWRWLFLVQGIPSVILGIATYFYLSDKPANAKWLSADEKKTLINMIEREDLSNSGHVGRQSVASQVFSPDVLLLSVAYFGLVAALNSNGTWTPQILREAAQHVSFTSIGLLSAIPPLVGIVAMLSWSTFSDRTQERTWSSVAAFLVTIVGWCVIVLAPGPELRVLGLALTTGGAAAAQPVFWALPNKVLTPSARPAGIAFICTIGLIASAVSPLIIGFLRDMTGSFTSGLMYVAAMVFVGMICILVSHARQRSKADVGGMRLKSESV